MNRGVLFSSVAFLAVAAAGVGFAQTPVFDTPIYAYKDNRDVVLEWDPATNADGYRVYRFEGLPPPSPPWTPLATVAGLQYRDAGAVDGPPYRYYYLVGAYNADGEARAPNMAFKINIPLECASGGLCGRFVSVPYLFIPKGRGVQATQSDLCEPSTPEEILEIVQEVDYSECHNHHWYCPRPPFGIPFDLVAGTGYRVLVYVPGTLDLVGSHDPEYHPGGSKAVTLLPEEDCECTFSLVSVPYHATVQSAEGLCLELGASAPDFIATFLSDGEQPLTHICGTPFTDFPIEPGDAVAIRGTVAGWQPEVYR